MFRVPGSRVQEPIEPWEPNAHRPLVAASVIQSRHHLFVERIGFLPRIPDSRESERSGLADRVDHVEHDALLARVVEVQAVACGQIEQIVVGEHAVGGRVHVVAGHERFRLAAWRLEQAGLRVVRAVGQKLQRQKWMGRPAFPQVDLDGVDIPLVAFIEHGHEVEREPSEHAFLHQPAADLERLAHDRGGVVRAVPETGSRDTPGRSVRRASDRAWKELQPRQAGSRAAARSGCRTRVR